MKLQFWVPGIPQPQGSKSRGRYGQMYETAKGLKAWREAVAWAAVMEDRHRPLMLGPITLRCTFYFPRPKSHFRANGEVKEQFRCVYATSKRHSRDVDKLCRAIGDSLSGILYQDDSQVTHLEASKYWAVAEPGVMVTVWEIQEDVAEGTVEARQGKNAAPPVPSTTPREKMDSEANTAP